MHEPTGMTFAEIDTALRTSGISLDPWDEDFLDGNRPLNLDELLALLPDATEDEICSYGELRWAELRRTVPAPLDDGFQTGECGNSR